MIKQEWQSIVSFLRFIIGNVAKMFILEKAIQNRAQNLKKIHDNQSSCTFISIKEEVTRHLRKEYYDEWTEQNKTQLLLQGNKESKEKGKNAELVWTSSERLEMSLVINNKKRLPWQGNGRKTVEYFFWKWNHGQAENVSEGPEDWSPGGSQR